MTPQVTPSTKAIQTSQPTQLELLRAQELNVHPDEITKQSKIWQKLYALEQEGQGLTPDQRAAMDNAEKILGQRFLFSAKETEAAPSGALTKVKPKFSGPTQGVAGCRRASSREHYSVRKPKEASKMPAVSQAQREALNAKFGHAWVKQHHFDNKGMKLPESAKLNGLPRSKR